MGFIKKSNAAFFLFVNAFLWGSSYVWSKMLLGYLPRFSILMLSSLGGLVATLLLFYPSVRTIRPGEAALSAGISIFSIISNTFFMFALQYTGSSNTAFIVQTSVIITPVLMALLDKKMPEGKIVLSSFGALAGIFLLTCDFKSFTLNKGAMLAFGNAVCFSYLTAQNRNSKRVDPIHFALVHQFTNTVAFLSLALLLERPVINFSGLKSLPFVLLISASMVISAATVLIQSTAIKYVRAEKATIIYTFEPVVALWLAYIFIGEKPDGLKSIAGCILILASVFCSISRKRAMGETVFGIYAGRRLKKKQKSIIDSPYFLQNWYNN